MFYTIDFDNLVEQNMKCLSVLHNDYWLWHRRLGHCSMYIIFKL